jgi:hypothetical protein
MVDHGMSVNRHCRCKQMHGPILGSCVLCEQNHLEHKTHVPENIQDLLRPHIEPLARPMELKVSDGRPAPESLKGLAETDYLARAIGKHR